MLKTFPMGLESPAAFKIVLEVLDNKRIKRIKIISEEIKLLLFIVSIIVYTESQKPSTDNIIELEFLTDFFSVRFTQKCKIVEFLSSVVNILCYYDIFVIVWKPMLTDYHELWLILYFFFFSFYLYPFSVPESHPGMHIAFKSHFSLSFSWL